MTSLYLLASLLFIGASRVAFATNYVELYVIVDPKVISNYVDLGYTTATAKTAFNLNMDYFMSEVNDFFATMVDAEGVDVKVHVKQTDFLTTEMFIDCKLVDSQYLQADLALEVMKKYLIDNNSHATVGYDIALVLTGYNLFKDMGSYNEVGYAVTGKACDSEKALTVVEFDGTHSTAVTIAHELAHNLGSGHDADSTCPPTEGHIMSATSHPTNAKRWSFSTCSSVAVKNYIAALDNNCLANNPGTAATFSISSLSGKDIIDPNKVCQRKLGNVDSFFCRYKSLQVYNTVSAVKGDVVCQLLYCAQKNSISCSSATPTEGMVCDANKRCSKGKCVAATFDTPSSVTADCVFGDMDTTNLLGTGKTCAQYIESEGTLKCYDASIFSYCCTTCKAKHTGISGCEFGDRNLACKNYSDAQICPNNASVCCEKCKDWSRRRRRSSSGVTPLPKLPAVTDAPTINPAVTEARDDGGVQTSS